jgi:hypothetical protein
VITTILIVMVFANLPGCGMPDVLSSVKRIDGGALSSSVFFSDQPSWVLGLFSFRLICFLRSARFLHHAHILLALRKTCSAVFNCHYYFSCWQRFTLEYSACSDAGLVTACWCLRLRFPTQHHANLGVGFDSTEQTGAGEPGLAWNA